MEGATAAGSAGSDGRSGISAAGPVPVGSADRSALLSLLRHAGATAQRRGVAALVRLRTQWGRSLQLRVVGTTLIFSAAVIATLGFFLLQQIAGGLVQNKEKAAATLASEGARIASNQLDQNFALPDSINADGLIYNTLLKLPQDRDAGGTGAAVMVNTELSPDADVLGWYQGPYLRSAIPSKLIAQVQKDQLANRSLDIGQASSEPTTLIQTGPDGRHSVATPGLAIGVPLGQYYQMYYLFPLQPEQQTLALVQRAIVAVGLALLFLLVAIASLVTRWVVVPVRQAAQGAQRLSTGNLDERMPVRGTDDLAALATSFNEMAESLQEKMDELQELSHVQRQFVSDVSHELRTPLTTIRIAADVLFASRQQLDQASARSAELLQGQLERFESLLADLLEISRYDANAATLEPEPVDLCDIVRNSADVAQQLAERRGAKIEFRLPASPCVAEVDRRRVERILRNLLVNAVEHGENRDAVVTVAGDRDAVAIAVRDFGVGLLAGEENLVFDRFWRADPARARTTGGTGLGLSIALEDALLHGGWLEAWGERGRGSVFRLTLPRITGAELAGSPLPLVPDDVEPSVGPGDGTVRAALLPPPATGPQRPAAVPGAPAVLSTAATLRPTAQLSPAARPGTPAQQAAAQQSSAAAQQAAAAAKEAMAAVQRAVTPPNGSPPEGR
jgi:two-component system sensor histidine kinase MtrB